MRTSLFKRVVEEAVVSLQIRSFFFFFFFCQLGPMGGEAVFLWSVGLLAGSRRPNNAAICVVHGGHG